MRAAREMVRGGTGPEAAAGPTLALGRVEAPARLRRILQVGDGWGTRAAWALGRTGRTGLAGITLLLGSALFLVSTHLQVVGEVESLRGELAAARERAHAPVAAQIPEPLATLPVLPGRAEMPALLRRLFREATQARLALDTGRYEVKSTTRGEVVRHRVVFPVTGAYPQIRAFLDAILSKMPEVALSDLVIERKSIGDGDVEAQIQLTVFTRSEGSAASPPGESRTGTPDRKAAPRAATPGPERSRVPAVPVALGAPEALPASDRVVPPTHASALFAQHTWVVLPKLPPLPKAPVPPPSPPPEPTAPPLPYTFVGSFAPGGDPPVFFLSRGDVVVEARVGDRLDGVYQLESAADGQLVFVYLPLDIRQSLSAGASK